jgi:hypothetical protein
VHVLAAADRELGFKLGSALEQHPALGLPCGTVGHLAREFALAIGRRSGVVLGELQALALERECRGVAGPTGQQAAGGSLEFSDARGRFVCAASRLGARAACGVELVGEVFGVVADALV